ncbi:MAG: glycosyltransferase family 4 protein [Candidatus Pacebacteria bacterium]|nr:glycosyltransferase family 4 protein [Candidatus Paceibacterota bacterium]
MAKKSKTKQLISIVGTRAFPDEFSGTSGIETIISEAVPRLLAMDNKLHFKIYVRSPYQKIQLLSKNIKLVKVPTLTGKVLEPIAYVFLSAILVLFDNSKVVWIHGTGMSIFSFLFRLRGKKVVLQIHGLDWQRDKWNWIEKKAFSILSTFAIQHIDKLVVVSEKLAIDIKGLCKKKAIVVRPGLPKLENTSQIDKKIDGPFLLYLGRISPEKNIHLLIDSFEDLQRLTKRYQLIIAGSNSISESYINRLKEKSMKNKNIVWFGHANRQQKGWLHRNASLTLSFSNLEGLSMSLLESISIGKYSLVDKTTVDASIASLPNIFYMESRNPKLLGQQLYRILKNVQQNPKISYTGQEKALLKHYCSWEKMSNQLYKLLTA